MAARLHNRIGAGLRWRVRALCGPEALEAAVAGWRRYRRHSATRWRRRVNRLRIGYVMATRRGDRRLLWVNPRDIRCTINVDDPTLRGSSPWHLGSVEGGDWDLGGVPVREYWGLYSILEQRIGMHRPYDQIPQFTQALEGLRQGRAWYNCRTEEAVRKALQDFEQLCETIRREGYRTQAQLGTGRPHNEVRIQIGRRGDMLFEEGFHRLVIAQYLGLDRIPVMVYRRHADWARLRDAVKRIVLQRGFFHQPFGHPDLDVLPQWYGNHLKDQAFYGHERWDYILGSLPVKSGSVLDIGAYFGYFSRRFEDAGFDVTAVEIDPCNHEVLRLYRDMTGHRFSALNTSVFDLERREFDVVLALSVFHHIVKTRAGHERLVAFLRGLRCRALYFEPGRSGPGMYRDYAEPEFVQFVQENSGLGRSRCLGPTKVGRNLYLLTP